MAKMKSVRKEVKNKLKRLDCFFEEAKEGDLVQVKLNAYGLMKEFGYDDLDYLKDFIAFYKGSVEESSKSKLRTLRFEYEGRGCKVNETYVDSISILGPVKRYKK